ncbi:MAG: hypothetical protein QM534_18635 [Sediminibacterium sp.]|nr:hypothetical protein [Sediminibacterium sp.]
MSDFNPTDTIDGIKKAADKAAKLSEKWSESTATKNAVKTFMADNKAFFSKASTVMGVLSAGCSIADAMGLFGPSEHEQVMNKLNLIEKKIDTLGKEMNLRFDSLAAQVNYNTATAILAGNEADIRTQLSHRDYYLSLLNTGNEADINDARDTFLDSPDTLDKDITAYYLAFTQNDKAKNILLATTDYFLGAPGPLLSKGYDMIYLVQEAAKAIGLKKRLRKEIKEKDKFNLGQCIISINNDFDYNYKQKIEDMLSALENQITSCLDNIEVSIPKFYEIWLKKNLLRNPEKMSNPTMLCSRFEENFPMINFMSIEYANCRGDDEHADGLRTSRAIIEYHQSSIDRNLLIWWQWVPEPGTYSEAELQRKAKSIQLSENGKMQTLAKMPEYTTYQEYADFHTVTKRNYNIPKIIEAKTKTSLFYYSAGSHALVVRRSKAGRVNWAHSSNCSPLALVLIDTGFYDVFWMILDV